MALLGALAATRRTIWMAVTGSPRHYDDADAAIWALRYDAVRREVTFRKAHSWVERIEGVDKFLEYLEEEQILDHWDSRRLAGLTARSFWFELRKQATAEQSNCLVFETARRRHTKAE